MIENEKNNLEHAPIALFVYNRPFHTKKTLESLQRCPEFENSMLYVFCDGAKKKEDQQKVKETRLIVDNMVGATGQIIRADSNLGLAASIIHGVTQLCNSHGRVIVVEDDLIVNPLFLEYLNAALDRYENEEQVMQVSAHMFPIEQLSKRQEAFFLPITTSWGWATWKRAWDCFDVQAQGWQRLTSDRQMRNEFDCNSAFNYASMLEKQMTGHSDSWAIRWYWSVFNKSGLVLFPPISLIRNTGFDGSGTHGWRQAKSTLNNSGENIVGSIKLPTDVMIDEQAFSMIKNMLSNIKGGLFSRLKMLLGFFQK